MPKISQGNGQFKAQSLSIQVSNRVKCNGACQFCISRTTPSTPDCENDILDFKRLDIGFRYAKSLDASHIILTGKADPSQEDLAYLGTIIERGVKYIPLADIHTNGVIFLAKEMSGRFKPIDHLRECGLTMLTLSLAHHDIQKNSMMMGISPDTKPLISIASREYGLCTRCSVVLAKSGIATFKDLMDYIYTVGALGAHMVVIRELWYPDDYAQRNAEVFEWNKENYISAYDMQEKFVKMVGKQRGLHERERLPWGTRVFTLDGIWDDPDHGMNITFANCGENSAPVLKSVVHKPNGHGYRNWDSNGEILY
jgi:molybdenum cofactor biosynthesis enzyme MoaA